MSTSWIDDPPIRNGIRRMLENRSEMMTGGGGVIGWKLAFGAPTWLDRFAIPGPLLGFLPASRQLRSGATVEIGGWNTPVAEPELAVHLGADVDDPARVTTAISAVSAAIELADVHPPPDDLEEVLAGNVFHRGVILGEPDPDRAGGDLDGIVGHVTRNGSEMATVTDLEVLTGELGTILTHTARLLDVFGEGLRSGEVIILGSVIPPLQIHPGDTVGFHPTPLEGVSVSLS